ncbi:MAG: hypothetical protein LUD72_11235 [Bacteroidales bacterium]|nr:hypothetical protein [Bacteroidales bacterium]
MAKSIPQTFPSAPRVLFVVAPGSSVLLRPGATATPEVEMSALKSGKQERFVRNLIDGMSQRQAYRDAYPTSEGWPDATVDSKASVLAKNGKVLERYNELQKEAATPAMMSYEFKREQLREYVKDPETSATDKMRAIDLDNKMEGVYINKVEVSKPVSETVKELEEYIDERKQGDGGADL